MIRVVCFKWRPRPKTGYIEPPTTVKYGPDHVHVLRNMVRRHLSMPHEFVCVTDDPEGLDPQIRIVPLWDHCIELGGCYNRLYTFSPDMRDVIGERFVCIDLDCVITGELDPLFDRPEDFVINSYKTLSPATDPDQHYNGGMYLMTAGARSEVWDTFEGEKSAQQVVEANRRNEVVGGDQAWIKLILGKAEPRWTEADGVYEARQVDRSLPEGARIVFFAGRRDPTQWTDRPWVRENWQ